MTSKIEQVLMDFKSSVEDKEYSFKELSQLLEVAYKKSFKGKSTKPKSDVKKEPSAYNNFVKNEILKIKAENTEGNIDPKDFMRLPKDRFVVGMNAANKGVMPNRKAFGENLLAFSMFAQKFDDAILYLHTDASGALGGIRLMDLILSVGRK